MLYELYEIESKRRLVLSASFNANNKEKDNVYMRIYVL